MCIRDSGKTVQSLGWKEIYQRSLDEDSDSEVREQKLPQIREGDGLSVGKIELTQGKTKPPAPFTEASLLAAMENPIPVSYTHLDVYKRQII